MPELDVPRVLGPRVLVRRLVPSDEEAFFANMSDSRALHGPWVAPPADARAFGEYLARFGPTFVPLGVFCGTGALAGIFNISQIVLGHFCSAYLGYYAFAPHARKGYMREGIDLVLYLAFRHLGLHRLEANVQPGNEASLALVRSAGFQKEGFSPGYLFVAGAYRDHERWAIRQEIWTPRPDIVVEHVRAEAI